ncbi:MAG: hypothetical protein IJ233_02270 [Pyramidobacter sp.]|nr:hypothetical protein [Pyramidobacter sp.]
MKMMKNTGRAAALALSAFLLSGAAWAESLSGNSLYVTDGMGGAALSADSISRNDITEISGNTASSDVSDVLGGAFYSSGDVTLTAAGSSITMKNNTSPALSWPTCMPAATARSACARRP